MGRVHSELPGILPTQRLHVECFTDYMVDMQTLMRPLGLSQRDTLERVKENSTPALRKFVRPYECRNLDALMALADEFEELDIQRERFELERNHRARYQRYFPRGEQNAVCRRCQEETTGPSRHDTNGREEGIKPSASLPGTNRRERGEALAAASWPPGRSGPGPATAEHEGARSIGNKNTGYT
ncbi:uncharacterized protein LOC113564613 [Drosophila erecta]|uniref:uncharacterized protein LOC113564613 n=1 Tax=Drosophila erecta TaxID=7220 RepID=UPI000F067A8F|nr:uncharacterized protein LOC113564613 [Drosophila erecta]